jgi:transposase
MQKISNDLENKIIDLYNQGYKIKDISKICKVHPTTVSRVANRNSLCRECSKLTLSEKINICKLYNLGKTCSDIAKLYNVSRNTISTILHNNNINIRRSNLDTYFELVEAIFLLD